MDFDSILMLISLASVVMTPIYARWSALAFARFHLSRWSRAIGVGVLSVSFMAATYVGPWLLMLFVHGQLSRNLSDPVMWKIAAILFAPVMLFQAVVAVAMGLHRQQSEAPIAEETIATEPPKKRFERFVETARE